MHLTTRNVNTAFLEIVELFYKPNGKPYDYCGLVKERPSRNGPVLVIDEPVTVTYTHPRERVLFNTVRDANPFFHLYESLWMLAGRNDVASLAYYNSKIGQFSDDGKTFNGAYGYRWRHAAGKSVEYDTGIGGGSEYQSLDQLDLLVAHLKADPNSRRAVLQMWNVEDDLLKIGQPNPRGEIGAYRVGDRVVPSDASEDVCCNLCVMFSVRREGPKEWYADHIAPPPVQTYLDMTVINRSNDLLWGMLGANYVHFTILQEYMAARLGVEVGKYHHVTNNLHVYKDRGDWKPEELLGDHPPAAYNEHGTTFTYHEDNKKYVTVPVTASVPLVQNPEAFERELPVFVEYHGGPLTRHSSSDEYSESLLHDVAKPMLWAYHRYKTHHHDEAVGWLKHIKADDWRIACTNWLKKRLDKKQK